MRKLASGSASPMILLSVLFVSVVLYIVLMLNVLDRLTNQRDELRRITSKWLHIEISLAAQTQTDAATPLEFRVTLLDFQARLTTYLELPWFASLQRAYPDLRLRCDRVRAAVSSLVADTETARRNQDLRAGAGNVEGNLDSLLQWMGSYRAAQRSAILVLLLVLVVFIVLSGFLMLVFGNIVRIREARFLAAIDSMSDAVILTDSRNVVFHANPAAHRLFGASGTSLEDRPPPEVIADSSIEERELMLADMTGHKRPVSVKMERVRERSGRSRGSVYVVRDLTEWKKLAATIASTFISLQVEEADRIVAHALSQASELFEAEKYALLIQPGSGPQETMRGSTVFPPRLERRILEAVRHGAQVYLDGASVWEDDAEQLAEASLAWVGAVPLRLSGVVVGALALGSSLPHAPWSERATAGAQVLTDLVAELLTKKWAMIEIDRLGSEYERLVESANVPIWGVDGAGRINVWNMAMANLTGIPKSDALGSVAESVLATGDRGSIVSQYISEVLMGNPISDRELTFGANTEDPLTLLLSGSPRLDSAARVTGAIFVGQDITARVAGERRIKEQARELVETQEAERLRISRDLHDKVAQDLSAARIMCETMFDAHSDDGIQLRRSVASLSETIASALQSIRRTVYDLRPPAIEEFGLVASLERLCESFSESESLPVTFQSAGIEELRFSSRQAVNMYRIVQESLANVRRHAGARSVVVSLVRSMPDLILRIADDGRGFDVDRTLGGAAERREMGLLGIRERVTLLDGTFAISSKQGSGTQLKITLPLPGKEKSNGAA